MLIIKAIQQQFYNLLTNYRNKQLILAVLKNNNVNIFYLIKSTFNENALKILG